MNSKLGPKNISSVIDAMYAMVSGPAGPRDWSMQSKVFHPDARQMRTGIDGEGKPWIKIMTLDQYSADTGEFFATNDFFEVEVARRVQVFGNIAHAWSVYEARKDPDDMLPERRGINSIQLYCNEVGEWQITSMIWDNERQGVEVDWSL